MVTRVQYPGVLMMALCLMAAPLKPAHAIFQSNEKRTSPELEKHAAEGCADSQAALGEYYVYIKDYAQAEKWLRKSAEQGYSGGMLGLGDLYARGQGVPRDDKEAIKWWRKTLTAELPSTSRWGDILVTGGDKSKARGRLSGMYEDGRGVEKNAAEAERLRNEARILPGMDQLREKAKSGKAEDENKLGEYLRMDWNPKRDYDEAAEWFKKAAGKGYARAMYNLGLLADNPAHDPRKREDDINLLPQALEWYEKAAQHGDTDARDKLVKYFYHGAAPNYLEVWFWLNTYSACDLPDEWVAWRDDAASKLTPEQKAEAEKRLTAWNKANAGSK